MSKCCIFLAFMTLLFSLQNLNAEPSKVFVTQRCASDIRKTAYILLIGENAKERLMMSKCLSDNIEEDLNLAKCKCNNKMEAMTCAQKVSKEIGISPEAYGKGIGDKCGMDLIKRLRLNFPNLIH